MTSMTLNYTSLKKVLWGYQSAKWTAPYAGTKTTVAAVNLFDLGEGKSDLASGRLISLHF